MQGIDRREVLTGIGLALFGASAVRAEPRSSDQETSELAWILAGLTALGRGTDTLDRTTDYWRAVEKRFAPFSGHVAVAGLGGDFSLPRLIGNAANYRFTTAGGVDRIPGSQPMWGDAPGDLFTKLRADIEDFARKSRVRDFLVGQDKALRAARAPMYRSHDVADMQAWLESQFKARPATMQVYVSPLTGSWNFTNLNPTSPRLWVPTVATPPDEYTRFRVVRAVFTEVDHSYVNPATARLGSEAVAFMTVANGWATGPAWESYSTPELVMNEYMTFAVFLAYAKARLSAPDYDRIDQNTRAMMARRGFPRFGLFADALLQRHDDQTGSLETAYPALVAAVSSGPTASRHPRDALAPRP